MSATVAILSTLDTKRAEAEFLKAEIEAAGGHAMLLDMGLLEAPEGVADVSRETVVEAGGGDLAELLKDPSRQDAAPILIAGAFSVLDGLRREGKIHAVLALGGTQGTSNASQVLQQLPYGFPKVMLSTVASGDTSPFVGIKDVTMMFSVADILGLNPFTRMILANAAGASLGMARVAAGRETRPADRKVIAMTNLGVLTKGAMRAIERFEKAGWEVVTFHAIGAGGRAMERMMEEGLVAGVFDYALGEITDELFEGLRAADENRLTVAARLGLPQVVVPGGAEHVGILLHEPNQVPDAWKDHDWTFHNPFVFVPRLRAEEMVRLAARIAERLSGAGAETTFLMPLDGVSRYSMPEGELRDEASDRAFWEALEPALPAPVHREAIPAHAEDDAFVDRAVDLLVEKLAAGA